METHIREFTGKVQSQGTNSFMPQTMYEVQIKNANNEWEGSGVYQGDITHAEQVEKNYLSGKPGWFMQGWFDKVTSVI